MSILRQYIHPNTIIIILADAATAVLAFVCGIYTRFGFIDESVHKYQNMESRCAVFITVILFCSFFVELYSLDHIHGKRDICIRIGLSTCLSFLFLTSLYYLIPDIGIGRGLLAISLLTFALLQGIVHILLGASTYLSGLSKRVLILGTGPTADAIGCIVSAQNHQYVLAGYINCPVEPIAVPMSRVVGSDISVVETTRRERADKLVISLAEKRGVLPLQEMLECKFSGIDVLDAPSFYEQLTGKLLIEHTKPSWFIFSDGFKKTPFRCFYKTAFDLLCAIVGLILCAPLLPLIALAIRIDSPGPVFFRQIRIGENGKPFNICKFRTMFRDAEKKTGAVWATKNDSRITRVGRFLRKTRLDELPQIFNVLKGDMSIVGPRPERPEFIKELSQIIPYYVARHAIKPGITGWAQIKYAYGASVEDAVEKLRYDLYYIKHCSLIFDLLIVMETIKVVIFGKGAR